MVESSNFRPLLLLLTAVTLTLFFAAILILRKTAESVKVSPSRTTLRMAMIWSASFLLIRYLIGHNQRIFSSGIVSFIVYFLGFLLPFLSYYFWLKDQRKPNDFQEDIDEIGSSSEIADSDNKSHD